MRKCKVCGTTFEPKFSSLQAGCSVPCLIAIGRGKQAKTKKVESLAFKRAVREKDKTWHLNTLQTIFNRFIRLRDADEPCISCGTRNDVQYCAGHFLTRGGFPELRFEEKNVHKQCNRNCNMGLSGNVKLYRLGLIKKIGLAEVEKLEGPHEPKKYTIDDLKEMIVHYRQLNRELEKGAT